MQENGERIPCIVHCFNDSGFATGFPPVSDTECLLLHPHFHGSGRRAGLPQMEVHQPIHRQIAGAGTGKTYLAMGQGFGK
jgi:hypothetical protein